MRLLAPLLGIVLVFGGTARADDAKARQLYTDGEAAFLGGRYAEAARAFEQAFAESRRTSFLWNCAQSYRRQYEVDNDVVNLKRAATVYRNYRELLPPTADHTEVDAAIVEVNRQIEAVPKPAAAPPPVEKAAPPIVSVPAAATVKTPEPPPRASRKGLWIGLGVGAGVVVAGAAIGLGVGLGGKTVEQGIMPGNLDPGFQRIMP